MCGRKALTLLSSVFAVCSLGLLGIAVSTDYWLYLEEGIIMPLNQSTEIRMSLHSGLWRVCFLAGERVLCLKSDHGVATFPSTVYLFDGTHERNIAIAAFFFPSNAEMFFFLARIFILGRIQPTRQQSPT